MLNSTRRCPSCGKGFETRNVQRIYCSQPCRAKGFRRGYRPPRSAAALEIPKPPSWPTTQIPVAVVTTAADRGRYRMGTELAEEVGAEAISVDDMQLGTGLTHLNAWRWLAGGNHAWSVVLEDDAVPVRDFREQLDVILDVAPTPIVSLYLGRTSPPHWQDSIAASIAPRFSDPCFLLASDLLHGVGYAVRTSMVKDMIEQVQWHVGVGEPIDEAVSQWAHRIACLVSYTRPSVVDHLDGPSLHSATEWQPRSGIRKAWIWDSRPVWNSSSAVMETPLVMR